MENLVLTDDWVVFSKNYECSGSQRYEYEYIYSVKKTTFTNEEAKDFIESCYFPEPIIPQLFYNTSNNFHKYEKTHFTSDKMKKLAIHYPKMKNEKASKMVRKEEKTPYPYRTCCICKKNHLYFLREHLNTEKAQDDGWGTIKIESNDYFCLESMAEVRISYEETYTPDY